MFPSQNDFSVKYSYMLVFLYIMVYNIICDMGRPAYRMPVRIRVPVICDTVPQQTGT